MRVILKDDVKNLGKIGDIVDVSDGYGRNYLIPRGLAFPASEKNIKALEHEKRLISAKAIKLKKETELLAERLSHMTLSIKAKAGEEEKLFGSITTMDIKDALKGEGIDIDRKRILLQEPIRRLGSYTVGIKLAQDIISEINIRVVSE